MFEPAYYEAERDCYEKVKIGMTYEEVDAVVGHLFADGPYGIDEKGEGQIYLDHGLQLDGSCRIMFENFRVISNDLLFTYF